MTQMLIYNIEYFYDTSLHWYNIKLLVNIYSDNV